MHQTDRTRPAKPYDRPLLLLHNGPDKNATFRLSDSVAFQLIGRVANTLIVLQAAWRRGAGELPDDRGWIDADAVRRLFRSEIGKTIADDTAQSYIALTARVLRRHYRDQRITTTLPVETSRGRGIHLVLPLTVKDPTGRISWAAA